MDSGPIAGDGYPLAAILGSGFLGLLLAWAVAEAAHLTAMAHEGAHAVIGSLTGGRVGQITFTRRGEGSTPVDASNWLNDILTDLAGYLGPSAFGLLGVGLLKSGNPAEVLWVSIILLVALLWMSGNFTMLFKVLATGWIFILFVQYGTPWLQMMAALTWVWMLLGTGLFTAWRHRGGGGDGQSLHAKTHVPRQFWWLVFVAGSGLGLVFGASVLFQMAA